MDIAEWIINAAFRPPAVPKLTALIRDGLGVTVKAIFFAGVSQTLPIALLVGFISGALFASNLRRNQNNA